MNHFEYLRGGHMMKKVLAGLSVFAVIAVLSTMWLYGCFDTFNDDINGEFNVEDHSVYKTMYNVEQVNDFVYLGKIDDISELRKQAQKIWIGKYGIKVRIEQRPYDVFYDSQHELYLVSGTMDVALGGVANILVERGNGRVLAVWHEK